MNSPKNGSEITGEIELPHGFNPLRCQIQDGRLTSLEAKTAADHDSIATVRLSFEGQMAEIKRHIDKQGYRLGLYVISLGVVTFLSADSSSPIGKLLAMVMP